MPYISKLKQELLDESIEKILNRVYNEQDKTIDYGALEYVIFRLVLQLSQTNMKFDNLNSLIGVLATTQAEIQRRVLGPYEDLKLIESWNK